MMTVCEQWSEMMARDSRILALVEEFPVAANWQHLDLFCAERYQRVAGPMWDQAKKIVRGEKE